MHRTATLLSIAALSVILSAGVAAQCNPHNIAATILSQDVPIGQDIVVNYVTQGHHNGMWLYTLQSLWTGAIPLEFGYCIPLCAPVNLLGANYVASSKAQFRFTVPLEPALVGLKVYLAGVISNGTQLGTGTSNEVLAHLRLEDWPLP
ncbi:MAG: hypothetical protein JXQ29_11150 [Planctomycetes bacterium]|nr:hypothetical protein [Planctomycetota bacterium]